jgi:hypothetical protein
MGSSSWSATMACVVGTALARRERTRPDVGVRGGLLAAHCGPQEEKFDGVRNNQQALDEPQLADQLRGRARPRRRVGTGNVHLRENSF